MTARRTPLIALLLALLLPLLTGACAAPSGDAGGGESVSAQEVARLGAFRWDGSDWRLTAWSNFGVLRDPADEG